MRKAVSRIAVDAFSRGRWYPNTPSEKGIIVVAGGEVHLTWITQGGGVCNFQPPRMCSFRPPLTGDMRTHRGPHARGRRNAL